MKQVIKRDGKEVKFNLKKIVSAIRRAGESSGEFGYDEALDLTNSVIQMFDNKEKATVEEIQDAVEKVLNENNYTKTARAFIVYREKHNDMRKDNNVMIDAVQSIDDYLDRSDWRVNANANQGYSLGGMILNTSGKVTANYWLSHVYPKEAGEAHRNGDIQIHDLDMLANYCTGWSLRALLQEGFNGVKGKVESKPPKHLASALGQMVNFWGCFTEETRIKKSDGSSISFREIMDQDIKEIEVLSYNDKTGQIEPAVMNNFHRTRTVDQTIELTFEGDKKVRCTLDHKFWTWNKGWVEAQDLTEEDDIAFLPERKYFTYKVTNLVNGEYYYGSHSTFDVDDDYLGSGVLIEESVKKYGRDCFKKEVLNYYQTNEELKKAEINLISGSICDKNCLNLRVTCLGRDNKETYNIHKYTNFHKILVRRGDKIAYVWRDRFDTELKDLGFEIADVNLVYNNGSKNFYDPEGKANLTKGVLYKDWSLPTFGKIRTKQSDFMKKLTNSIDESGEVWKVANGRRISVGLNRVGSDGLTPVQRKMKRVCSDGLTLSKHVAKVQLEKGVHPFQQSNIQKRNAAKANTPENRLKAMTTVCSKFLNWLVEKDYHVKDWDIKEVRFKYFGTNNIKVINRLPKLNKLKNDYPTIHNNVVSTLAE